MISCADLCASTLPEGVSKHADSIISVSIIDKDSQVIHSENSLLLSKNGIVAASCYAVSRWFDNRDNRMIITIQNNKNVPADFMLSSKCERGVAYIKIDGSGLAHTSPLRATTNRTSDTNYIGVLDDGRPEFKKVKLTTSSSGRFKLSAPSTEISGPVFNSKGEFLGLHMKINYIKGPYTSGIPAAAVTASLNRYQALLKKVDDALAAAAKSKPLHTKPDMPIDQPKPQETVLANLPQHEHFFNEAIILQNSGRYIEAAEYYKKTLAIKKDFIQAHTNLGVVLFNTGNYSDAAASFKKALAITPKSAYLNNRLGTSLLAAGNYAGANEAFRIAVKLNPSDTEAHFNLGVSKYLMGNREDAWVQYVILKELDPEKAKKLLNLIN
ncbi:MAG: tetratricopeptide repeat protein [Nitrospirae bacterium]|nr:tetratricopeptide repeat protein [Nitrospirota bacterium]